MADKRYTVIRPPDFMEEFRKVVTSPQKRNEIMEGVLFTLERDPESCKVASRMSPPVSIPMYAFHVAPWYHPNPIVIYFVISGEKVILVSLKETTSAEE